MTPRTRYLTSGEKALLIAGWQERLASLPADYDEVKYGGTGYPDVSMIPWCEKINALEGICTKQSCCGHISSDEQFKQSGHLWLRPSQGFSETFERHAFALATAEGIEVVRKHYAEFGEEIIDILFQGHEWGKFDQSMITILKFLERCRP